MFRQTEPALLAAALRTALAFPVLPWIVLRAWAVKALLRAGMTAKIAVWSVLPWVMSDRMALLSAAAHVVAVTVMVIATVALIAREVRRPVSHVLIRGVGAQTT